MAEESDVLVIGGGSVGVCTAYYLARKGCRVTLIEKGGICSGCSYGNACMIVPSHAMPVPAPGVIGKSLKWIFEEDSPLLIRPRVDWQFLLWLLRFAASCRRRPMERAIPVLRDLGRASLLLFQELAATEELSFDFERRGLMSVYTTAAGLEEGRAEAGAILEDIRRRLVNRRHMIANVTLDARGMDAFRPQLGAFLETLPAAPPQHQRWGREPMPAREGLSLPAQVNYVGKGARLTDHGYTWHGSAMVARGWLNTSWLWEKLRVQGGAYGGFAVHDRLSGVFNFLSYRDPQLLRTLDACDGAAAALARYRPGRDEVTRAIIGAIGSLDSYQLPDAQGYSSLMRHLVGLTDDMRQENREQVLATSGADLRRFADALAAVRDHGDIVVLGSAAALEAAGRERADLPGRVTKVL